VTTLQPIPPLGRTQRGNGHADKGIMQSGNNDRDWNDAIRDLPGAHILQTAEWGTFKQRTTDWTPDYCFWAASRTAAMILTRRIGPFSVIYVPKGPLFDYHNPTALNGILDQLEARANSGVIWLKIDPDVPIGVGVPGESDAVADPAGEAVQQTLIARGWRFSDSQVQYRNTIVIDLTAPEDELLARMSQSTRYKVRYGPKHGVTIRVATQADLPTLYRLYAHTGSRDGFLTRPMAYYLDEWGTLIQHDLAHALIAEVDGVAVAHVILFQFGQTCWYFYGASADEHRNLMPTYALQWEAMRWAKTRGCTRYDLWGAPDTFNDSDPMWGVYRFKVGFGGQVLRTIGAWDYVPSPALYALYTQAMPRILGGLKALRRARHSADNSDQGNVG